MEIVSAPVIPSQTESVSVPLAFWFNNPMDPDRLKAMLPVFLSFNIPKVAFKVGTSLIRPELLNFDRLMNWE